MENKSIALSQRVYRGLLYLYPRQHRQMYGTQMTQTFRDLVKDTLNQKGHGALVELWFGILTDVFVSAAFEHIAIFGRRMQMSRRSLIALCGVLIFSVLTGYVNLNANEVQAPVFCILTFSFLAGCFQPKGAWRWGILIGLSIPLSYFIGFAIKYRVVDPPHYPITLVVLIIPALIATYSGVLLNRLVVSARREAL